jgi:uncharacterized protein (TIGR03437 family)
MAVTGSLLLWALPTGADPRSEGGPGGNPAACAQSGCHVGTGVNAGGGRVELQFPNGTTYVPGEKQRLRLVVTDSAARVYGFQASARLASNEASAQAGTFTAQASQVIICQNGADRVSARCPANSPLEFINQIKPSASNTFEFDWTPPATASGNVRIYVAANAANGDGQKTGDRIYTANYTLTTGASGPVISASGGVTNGASFAAGVVSGSWTTIFGSNFTSVTRDWTGAIDAQGNFPTSLEGVSVTIDGKPAYVYFISPNQLNVQAPDLAGKTGPVEVKVRNAAGESAPVNAVAARELPGLFLFPHATKKYPAAVRSDGVFIGPAGLFQGVTTVPAKPGDVILLFGTGFGPTNPAVAPGRVFNGAAPLTNTLQMQIGGVTVTPAFAGLSSSGLNQFNLMVPDLPNGEQRVAMTINSVSIQTDVVLAVQR